MVSSDPCISLQLWTINVLRAALHAYNLRYIPRTTDSERGETRTGRLMLKAAPAAQNIRKVSINYLFK